VVSLSIQRHLQRSSYTPRTPSAQYTFCSPTHRHASALARLCCAKLDGFSHVIRRSDGTLLAGPHSRDPLDARCNPDIPEIYDLLRLPFSLRSLLPVRSRSIRNPSRLTNPPFRPSALFCIPRTSSSYSPRSQPPETLPHPSYPPIRIKVFHADEYP
jgi:hypothetical protein